MKGIHQKDCLIGIDISILQCIYHVALQVCFNIKIAVKTVKLGNIDVLSTTVQWAVHRFISSLCCIRRIQYQYMIKRA
jgi:hypothetical protein